MLLSTQFPLLNISAITVTTTFKGVDIDGHEAEYTYKVNKSAKQYEQDCDKDKLIKELQTKLKAMSDEKGTLESHVTTLEANNAAYKTHLDTAKQGEANKAQRVKALRRDNTKLEDQVKTLGLERDEMKVHADKMTSRYEGLRKAYELVSTLR